LVYLNALHGPFVYDDLMTVVGNGSIRDLDQPLRIVLHDIFRPVVNFSYAVDFALWGLEPLGFHLTSVLLHMLDVGLLFAIARRLAEDAGASTGAAVPPVTAGFVAAAALAVHPVMTEAVAYTSGRSELLCTAFLLAAFLLLRGFLLGGGRWRLPAGLGAFLLALASKETAAMLPFALLAWDLLLRPAGDPSRRGRVLRFHLPFAIAIAAAGLGRVVVYLSVEQGGLVQDLWRNALVESTVIWRYLALLVVPAGLSVVHPVRTITSPLDPAVVAAAVGYLVLTLTLVRLRRRAPLEVFGLVWFFLLVAPSHAIPLQEAMAEHRVYTAGCGLFLAVAAGFARLDARLGGRAGRRASWPRLVGLGVLVVLAGLTVARNRVWQDPVTLWGDAAHKAPQTWAAHYGHAEALRAAGRCAEAVEVYRRAVELQPGMVQPYLNAGICLAEVGRLDEAAAMLERARQLEPDNPKAYNNLGVLAARTGRLEEARDLFLEALVRDPLNVEARLALAQLHEVAFGEPARALELCQEVRSIAPGTPGVDACIARTSSRLATAE